MTISQHSERVNGTRPTPATPPPGRRWLRTKEERDADRARARTDAARAAIEEQRARDQLEMERLEAQRELDAVREQLDERRTARQQQAAAKRRTLRERVSQAVVLATANIGVNGVAVLGQVLALVLGLGWPWWAAVPVALIVESVAVNIGFIAHDKLLHGYSAGWLRALSYGIGAAVGWFNYTHNHGHALTGDYAAVFGACSVLSPVLWQIYSQWRHWQALRDQGMLEARAPKFSKLRWLIPSLRGETWQAFKLGVAEGIASPEVAIVEVRARDTARAARASVVDGHAAVIRAQSAALELALAQAGETADETSPQVEIKVSSGVPETPAEITGGGADETPDETKISTCDETADETSATPAMWRYWQTTVEVERRIPTGAELAKAGKCSPQWGARKAREWEAEMDGRTRRALLPGKKSAPKGGESR